MWCTITVYVVNKKKTYKQRESWDDFVQRIKCPLPKEALDCQ